MKEEPVEFLSGGLRIRGLLARPDKEGTYPASIICHPHPKFGGDMYNNVVSHVVKVLQCGEVVTMRFNFRGVGLSEGGYGGGEGEMEDVQRGIDYLKKQFFVDKNYIFVSGYSFGAWVALRAVHQRDDIAGLIGISPPISMYDFSFLEDDFRAKLIIMGDRDFVCPVGSAMRLYDLLPEPKEIKFIKGGDHFLWGFEEEVGRYMLEFIKALKK